jgi:hypothetical protein
MTFQAIQNSIVNERNNHGDHSVSGDDLYLAAAAAILAYLAADRDERALMRREAEHARQLLTESCPTIAAGIGS